MQLTFSETQKHPDDVHAKPRLGQPRTKGRVISYMSRQMHLFDRYSQESLPGL